MGFGAKDLLTYLCYSIFFVPVFSLLFVIGMLKGATFSPLVFIVIAFGDAGVAIGLWPLHLFWSIFSVARTKKFGPYMKCLLILLVPVQTALYIAVGIIASMFMGVGYGFIWPVMETFRAISKEGVPFCTRVENCFTEGTWSCVLGACTIVRDFADFSFHSYFSVVDELLESKGEEPIELNVLILPGCFLSATLGILVDLIVIPAIVLYKSPILLFKGWYRLIQDLFGREGPFLETVCVPFAGFWILLWPIVVVLGIIAGVFSSVGFGCYAAVVAYQENSTKRGLLYVIASASVFDEYTNDLLYLREGSCFPRPRYRERMDSSASMLPIQGLRNQFDAIYPNEPLIRTPSEKDKTLKAAMLLDSFFTSCKDIGKELLRDGAIQISDLEEWRHSKNKIVNIGIPAYAFLECFINSIRSGSRGFNLRDNVEITSANRPEGRVFDWLYEPMCIMKEQIRSLNLNETEERYFLKLCLYNGDTTRIDSWQNGGIPPEDPIKRAQLEGISRRLQGICLTLSRLPTSRRRFFEVVKAIEDEGNKNFGDLGSRHDTEAA
ncbi:hypothetical protein LWI28_019282 [Acer negundo]|uniref:Transmembrane protein n=1 Tax=Acer negundo TaxID=4023 RepID=A0AAD5IJT5_ACENE|nr:hypothetical protein LWI28_019282 [Acer negundo]KAK4840136.1 hypothetical protein QYF36_000706 [Acer negundo]